jgi:hypothetical protein
MRKTLLFIFACTALIACRVPRYAYAPSASDVPVLTQKGNSKLAAYYSTNGTGKTDNTALPLRGTSQGFDLQADYAFSNHIALQTSYFYRSETNGDPDFASSTEDDLFLGYKRNMVELGIGYYAPVNDSKRTWFQVFGGAGLGRSNINEQGKDSSGSYYLYDHSKMAKYYIQPAFVFIPNRTVVISLSSRFTVIKFNHIQTNYSADQLTDYRLAGLASNTFLFWEPAFTNSFGFEKAPGFRIEYQLGKSFRFNHNSEIDIKGFNFSIGLFFDIPKMFSSKSPSSSKKKDAFFP